MQAVSAARLVQLEVVGMITALCSVMFLGWTVPFAVVEQQMG